MIAHGSQRGFADPVVRVRGELVPLARVEPIRRLHERRAPLLEQVVPVHDALIPRPERRVDLGDHLANEPRVPRDEDAPSGFPAKLDVAKRSDGIVPHRARQRGARRRRGGNEAGGARRRRDEAPRRRRCGALPEIFGEDVSSSGRRREDAFARGARSRSAADVSAGAKLLRDGGVLELPRHRLHAQKLLNRLAQLGLLGRREGRAVAREAPERVARGKRRRRALESPVRSVSPRRAAAAAPRRNAGGPRGGPRGRARREKPRGVGRAEEASPGVSYSSALGRDRLAPSRRLTASLPRRARDRRRRARPSRDPRRTRWTARLRARDPRPAGSRGARGAPRGRR